MHHALNWLWQGVVVALATGVALGVMHRARPQARCAVCWAAVIATLMLPFLPLMFQSGTSAAAAITVVSPPATAPLMIPQAWWSSSVLMLLAWGGWASVCFARVVGAVRRLQHARGRSRPFPAVVEARLKCWTQVRSRGRQAGLVLVDDVGAAAVLGCGPPLIAVTPQMLARLEVEEIDRVIVHEWAHVQRRDDLLQLADAAVRIAAGWHPAIYWLLRQLSLEREAACDAVAVAVTGCPKRYAASLAAVASARLQQTGLAAAAGVLSAPPLRMRITRILSVQRLASARSSATAVVVAVPLIGVVATEIAARPLVHASDGVILTGGLMPVERLSSRILPSTLPALTPTASPARDNAQRTRRAPSETQSDAIVDDFEPVAEQQAEQAAHVDADEPLQGSDPSNPLLEASGADPEPTETAMAIPVMPPAAAASVPSVAPRGAAAENTTVAPWDVASNAAVAVARGSGKAAAATSGFFSRASRRLAAAF